MNILRKIYPLLYSFFAHSDEKGEYSSGYWQGLTRKKITEICAGRSGRILEIGHGAGMLLSKLAGQNPQRLVYGIDMNIAFCNYVADKSRNLRLENMRILMQDAYKLAFKDGVFETVICVNFIYNIATLSQLKWLFTEMSRVCKRCGSLIFEFRNARNPFFVFKYKFASSYDSTLKGLTLRCHQLEEIEQLLKETGLIIVRKETLGLPFLKKFAPIIVIEAKKS
ncbi:MAG: class I SAM-dependent methyltransferase [Candidatus Omnitrophota bacterium]